MVGGTRGGNVTQKGTPCKSMVASNCEKMGSMPLVRHPGGCPLPELKRTKVDHSIVFCSRHELRREKQHTLDVLLHHLLSQPLICHHGLGCHPVSNCCLSWKTTHPTAATSPLADSAQLVGKKARREDGMALVVAAGVGGRMKEGGDEMGVLTLVPS